MDTSKSILQKDIFIQILPRNANNYIEFIQEGNRTVGFFYGSEYIPKINDTLFYKACLSDFIVSQDRVRFTLKDISFSNKVYFENNQKTDENKVTNIDTPIQFKYPITYFGTRSNDTLYLRKITALDDSRSTLIIFKKNNPTF